MKYWIIIIVMCSLSCRNKNPVLPIPIDVREEIVIPKHYIVPKINSPLKIDGQATEPSWGQSEFTDKFIDIEGIKTPKFDTKIKMLWDDEFLYVFSEMKEPHIWGYLKQRDTVIFYNNDFEVFIDPTDANLSYGEIEVNALNTVWDLFLNKPYRVGGSADFNWNLDNLKTAVKIEGTLNYPNDIDSLWTVEMAIPLKPFVNMKENSKSFPEEGEQWRINFSRVEWDFDLINGKYYRKKEGGKFLKEYNWVWSNQKVINMHEPEKWGYLQFTENTTAEGINFITDVDLMIKQSAFALFRKTKFGELKFLTDKMTGHFQALIVSYAEGKELEVKFAKTKKGFEYKLQSPITNTTYIINHEGLLKAI